MNLRSPEVCLHSLAPARFQVAPTSLLTLQTCRGELCFWARQNEFVVCTAACIRLHWFAACAGGAHFAALRPSRPVVATRLSKHEAQRGCDADRYKSILFLLYLPNQPNQVSTYDWRSSRLPPTERKVSNGGSSPQRFRFDAGS